MKKNTLIEQYMNRRTPFKKTQQMRIDAEALERAEAERAGDEGFDTNKIPTEQKIAAIREKILRQDHDVYNASDAPEDK